MFHYKNFLSGLCSLIYPHNCLHCQVALSKNHLIICDACRSQITFNRPPFCPRCSRHMEEPHPSNCCKQCRKHDFAFDQAWGICLYNEHMRQLLHLFKYQNKIRLRFLFHDFIFFFLCNYPVPVNKFQGILPIPLHKIKLRERGYNQSELLAEKLSSVFRIPLIAKNLIRIRATKTQATLNEKERWTNVKDAFRIKQSQEIKGRSLLIVDDLMTTGATVCAASQALKNAGAKNVSVLTLAIA